MTEVMNHSTPAGGKKRSHDGELIVHDNTSSLTASPSPNQRPSSPAPSSSSSLTELSTMSSKDQPHPAQTTSNGSPDKKRKLTYAENQVELAVKKREKEERARLKADEKAKKEEAKRAKDEETRKKAEEKDAARRLKEVEKAEKEAERVEKQRVKDAEKAEKDAARAKKEAEKQAKKDKKEAEKLKKERAQSRIGTFFPAPTTRESSTTPDDISDGTSSKSSRRSSIASINMEEPELEIKSVTVINPEYTSWILPFFPHEHTEVAPVNRFLHESITDGKENPTSFEHGQNMRRTFQDVRRTLLPSRRYQRKLDSVKNIIARSSGTVEAPIDLTRDLSGANSDHQLAFTPYKILSFKEDVRPPYQGTYTRLVSPRSARRLSRNPTLKDLPNTDYDYDSEAEWQAPEEGDEDLDDEDEMSDDEDGANDMVDFLDDEDEIAKRKVTVSDVEPNCTGLCWEGECAPVVAGMKLDDYRMDFLHDDTALPIDPYSNTHWAQRSKPAVTKPAEVPKADASLSPAMQPPRLPIPTVHAPNLSPLRKFVVSARADDGQGPDNGLVKRPVQPHTGAAKKPGKQISDDLLPAFKDAIDGSDLNKVAMVEILKKQFPKFSKDVIKMTLENVAVRQGLKEADKKWVLIA